MDNVKKEKLINTFKMFFGKNQGTLVVYLVFVLITYFVSENFVDTTITNSLYGLILAYFGNKNAEDVKSINDEFAKMKIAKDQVDKLLVQAESTISILQNIIDYGVNDESLKKFSYIFQKKVN